MGIVFNIQKFSLHDGPGIRTIVFLKGCALHCLWCDNPESVNPRPELGVIRSRCNRCDNGVKKCVEVCRQKAITFDAEGVICINRERCNACGECVELCYPKALAIYGKERTVEDVFGEVCKDRRYYQDGGGGLTVSGGEPLQQGSFVLDLFRMCRKAGIHTCLETSGYASKKVWKEVLEFTDLVYYDMKHTNPYIHRELTGRPNELVRANAITVSKSGVPMLIRMPLIPGINDSPENIRDTAIFIIRKLGSHVAIELLPYHRLGEPKYQALDLLYPLQGKESCPIEYAENVRQMFQGYGVRSSISI